MPDPFTLVYQAIWSALTSATDWTAIVNPTTHVVRFDQGSDDPIPYQRDASQLPDAALFQGRFTLEPFTFNSMNCGAVQTYPLVCTMNDLQIDKLNVLKWQTLRAIFNYDPSGKLLLPSLVRRVVISEAKDDPRGNAGGLDRWIFALAITVEISLPKTAVASGTLP